MVELDKFIDFLVEHRKDDRISITKKMKYGFRYFYITLSIDEEPKTDKSNLISPSWRFSDSLEIVVDNRNVCIEVIYNNGSSNIIIEDESIVSKWSDQLDKLLNSNLQERLHDVFESTLSSCYNKNLHREYQMRKIFDKK